MWSNTGTIYYKAPEMFKSKYSQLVDIWAVGILAYELITGTLPFKHLYSSELIRQILEDEPQFDDTKITNNAIDFIRKCL